MFSLNIAATVSAVWEKYKGLLPLKSRHITKYAMQLGVCQLSQERAAITYITSVITNMPLKQTKKSQWSISVGSSHVTVCYQGDRDWWRKQQDCQVTAINLTKTKVLTLVLIQVTYYLNYCLVKGIGKKLGHLLGQHGHLLSRLVSEH